jgi:p-aminobenzoyl-glutamate transporter AbgT
MKNILIITVIIICSCISVAHAELSNEKRVEIEKMLRLTGMEKLMGQMKSQIISALRKEII